jgi:hypothetical protein
LAVDLQTETSVLSVTARFANSCYRRDMRIFVLPKEGVNQTFSVLQQAINILSEYGFKSARVGGYLNESAVVLIDPTEAPKAVQQLTRAGLRVTSD